MGRLSVSWTEDAVGELEAINEFYFIRNGSGAYNRKISVEIEKVVRRIEMYPESYPLAEDLQTRVAKVLKFQLLYFVSGSEAFIVGFFDPKQDPDKRFDRR